MEKVRIKKKEYEISGITKPADSLLQIAFTDTMPDKYGTIELFTAGDEQCAVFSGYSTVYKTDGSTVMLSNDGSVYAEPVVEPEPEQKEPTEEEKAEQERQNKIVDTESRIAAIDAEFRTLDYIGIKIATGRATIEEYKTEIARMTELADEKNELITELESLESDKEVQQNGKL